MFSHRNRSNQRPRRTLLWLESLEERQLLSGGGPPIITQLSSAGTEPTYLSPASTGVAGTQPAANGGTASAVGQPGADESYTNQPVSSSPSLSASANSAYQATALIRVAGNANAKGNASDSPFAGSAGTVVDYGGAGNSLTGLAASGLGGVSESAFAYYGQQPFYRLPPDQISQYRAIGSAVPQSGADNATLDAVTGRPDSTNGPGRAAIADAASRYNAEGLTSAWSARDREEQPLAPGDSPLVQAAALADERASLTGAGQPNALAASLAFSLPANLGQVAVGALPVDLAALERGVEQFFGQMSMLGEHLSSGEATQRLAPWLVAVALSTAALETARWRLWKPAPATPGLAARTRGVSTTCPNEIEAIPDP